MSDDDIANIFNRISEKIKDLKEKNVVLKQELEEEKAKNKQLLQSKENTQDAKVLGEQIKKALTTFHHLGDRLRKLGDILVEANDISDLQILFNQSMDKGNDLKQPLQQPLSMSNDIKNVDNAPEQPHVVAEKLELDPAQKINLNSPHSPENTLDQFTKKEQEREMTLKNELLEQIKKQIISEKKDPRNLYDKDEFFETKGSLNDSFEKKANSQDSSQNIDTPAWLMEGENEDPFADNEVLSNEEFTKNLEKFEL